jgi:hypothetical protein
MNSVGLSVPFSRVIYTFEDTLQRKSHFCIPFPGIAQPHYRFPHSCVCERFIYSHDRSAYSAAQKNMWTDHGEL